MPSTTVNEAGAERLSRKDRVLKKLNLGCGQFPKPGYVNVDLDSHAKADVFWDLASFPYPFGDGEFGLVEMDHVLEHLPDPFAVMREVHRILSPGGTAIVRVPHFSRGFSHPEHRRGFDVGFSLYFDREFPGGYIGVDFAHLSTRLTWFAQRWLKKRCLGTVQYSLGVLLGAVFDLLGNLSPYATSRLFCFLVGGFEEIEFRLRRL